MATALKWCYDIVNMIYEITERKAVTRQKGEQLGSCSRRDACSFLHRHATEDREDNAEWSEDTQETLTHSKHTLQCRKVKKRIDGKSLYSLKASPATNALKSLVHEGPGEEDRRVTIDIIPCVVVTRMKTDAFMAIVAHVVKLMVRATSARGREEGTWGAVAILKKKKKTSKIVVYLKTQIHWILVYWKLKKMGLNASAGHTMKFSGCTWYKIEFGKEKRAIWRHCPFKWTSWSKSLRTQFWGTTTWGNLTTSRLYQQRSVEFGEKICKFKPNIQLRFILLWRRQRHGRSYVHCSRSVRNSAITRWNASDSIAS